MNNRYFTFAANAHIFNSILETKFIFLAKTLSIQIRTNCIYVLSLFLTFSPNKTYPFPDEHNRSNAFGIREAESGTKSRLSVTGLRVEEEKVNEPITTSP